MYVNLCDQKIPSPYWPVSFGSIMHHRPLSSSSRAGSPGRLALLLPEYSSRRGGVQSRPVPACVPLPREGNHTLRIRVSPTFPIIYSIQLSFAVDFQCYLLLVSWCHMTTWATPQRPARPPPHKTHYSWCSLSLKWSLTNWFLLDYR